MIHLLRALIGFVVSALSCAASPAQPAEPVAAPISQLRPRIGLVLSGGGARGLAHVGVLKLLEREHVPVDVIVGTSMGAIIGGLYASGMSASQLEAELLALDWETVFAPRVSREQLSQRRKEEDFEVSPVIEIGMHEGELRAPLGALSGRGLESLLRRFTLPVRDIHAFDALPIPFRALATDMESGRPVILSSGDLALALRSSMSVPGVFAPTEVHGQILGDGGLTDNLPVDVARTMGVDLVIAVNIGTPLRTRSEIRGILTVSDQISRILTANNVNQSLKELGPRDLLITPDLGSVETADFDRLGEAAAFGEVAARALTAQLSRYAIDAPAYAAWSAAREVEPPPQLARIDAVRVRGARIVNPEVIAGAIRTQVGQDFDRQVIDDDLKRIYARGYFERVSYSLSDDPAVGRVLTADVAEKSWGPNYLRFGLGLSSDLRGDSFFTLVATHRSTWLNRLGAEWRNDLQIGHNDRLATEYYQPLTAAQRVFFALHAETERPRATRSTCT